MDFIIKDVGPLPGPTTKEDLSSHLILYLQESKYLLFMALEDPGVSQEKQLGQ
jgi:hypothetical protein